jgi:hypothetical protein
LNLSPQLQALGKYLAGEFDNQSQALEQPAWFVHLRLWMRPVPIFTEDSITLYAEQASVVNINQPYRPRILRLRDRETAALRADRDRENLEIEYYMFEDITSVAGAGRDRTLLQQITPEQIKFLPDCTLKVRAESTTADNYRFTTTPVTETPCNYNYQGNNYQVFLGLEATPQELLTYDKGIDPATGKGIWGALLGAYRFTKIQDFAEELLL